MILAAVNVDPSVRTSRVYRYDFADGILTELLPAESGNPAVFSLGSKVLLFNRQAGADKTFRALDPQADTPPPAARSVSGLTDGDPLDVVGLTPERSAILASGLGERLQILDLETATLSDVGTTALAQTTIRPVALYRSGDNVYVAHSGVSGLASGAGQGDGTQQLLAAKVAGDGLTWIDRNLATAAIEGVPLTASNPFGLVNRGTDMATVVGLCSSGTATCAAGADLFTGATVARLTTFGDDFPYEFFNRIVDGPDAKTVYAHVGLGDARNGVVKLNVETGVGVTIHEFPDERLYGLAYDASSHALFVGGADGLKGKITVYRDDSLLGSFQLDGVLYSAAFFAK